MAPCSAHTPRAMMCEPPARTPPSVTPEDPRRPRSFDPRIAIPDRTTTTTARLAARRASSGSRRRR
eukprot:418680-Pyramimonas_sp.AAC.1